MPEGKLLGRVILTCLGRVEVLELPRGTPVAELLSKAAKLFGRGRLTDRAGHVVTPKDSKLDGGFYTWSPEGKWQHQRKDSNKRTFATVSLRLLMHSLPVNVASRGIKTVSLAYQVQVIQVGYMSAGKGRAVGLTSMNMQITLNLKKGVSTGMEI